MMAQNHRVDIVTGAEPLVREALDHFLVSLGLEPRPWPGPKRILDSARPLDAKLLDDVLYGARAILVVFTDEDLGKPNPEKPGPPKTSKFSTSWQLQPSPDTLFEAGLVLGAAPERTILVQIGKLRRFKAWVWAREVLTLDNTLPARQKLMDRLVDLGCSIETRDGRWQDAGDFELARHEPLAGSEISTTPSEAIEEVAELGPDSPDLVFLRQLEQLLRRTGSESVAPEWIAQQLELGTAALQTKLDQLARQGYLEIVHLIGGRRKVAFSKAGRRVANSS